MFMFAPLFVGPLAYFVLGMPISPLLWPTIAATLLGAGVPSKLHCCWADTASHLRTSRQSRCFHARVSTAERACKQRGVSMLACRQRKASTHAYGRPRAGLAVRGGMSAGGESQLGSRQLLGMGIALVGTMGQASPDAADDDVMMYEPSHDHACLDSSGAELCCVSA